MTRPQVLVTGAHGFLMGYVIKELLGHGYGVVGLDNGWRYGNRHRGFADHPNLRFVSGDATDVPWLIDLLSNCQYFVAGAARVGGARMTNECPYDLFFENQRISSAAIDAAVRAHRTHGLRRAVFVSSSAVYDRARIVPSPETEADEAPPTAHSYGFEKLAMERLALTAVAQYALPCTIVRLANLVGVGAATPVAGRDDQPLQRRLEMGHLLPNLVYRTMANDGPVRIFGDGGQTRSYIHGADAARGMRLAMESPHAAGDRFNLTSPEVYSALEVATMVWRRVRGDEPLRVQFEPRPESDVQRREADGAKAREWLGFTAARSLAETIDEVVSWLRPTDASH